MTVTFCDPESVGVKFFPANWGFRSFFRSDFKRRRKVIKLEGWVGGGGACAPAALSLSPLQGL